MPGIAELSAEEVIDSPPTSPDHVNSQQQIDGNHVLPISDGYESEVLEDDNDLMMMLMGSGDAGMATEMLLRNSMHQQSLFYRQNEGQTGSSSVMQTSDGSQILTSSGGSTKSCTPDGHLDGQANGNSNGGALVSTSPSSTSSTGENGLNRSKKKQTSSSKTSNSKRDRHPPEDWYHICPPEMAGSNVSSPLNTPPTSGRVLKSFQPNQSQQAVTKQPGKSNGKVGNKKK